MKKRLKYKRILRISRILGAALLTFLIGLLPTCRLVFATELHADEQGFATAALQRPQQESVLFKEERKARIKMIAAYAKKELPNWAPGLPSFMRAPQDWLVRNIKSLGNGVGDTWESTGGSDAIMAIVQPLETVISTPNDDATHALWLAPDYSHKGFLPIHDAVILGVKSRHRLWGDAVVVNIHPHAGQNWRNSENFWGTDISFEFSKTTQSTDTPRKSLGKIALSYANGDRDVLHSKQRGFDVRSEFDFTHALSLNAGVKKNDSSKTDSYVMMRWRLAEF